MIFADKVVFIMALTIFAERMKQARTGAGTDKGSGRAKAGESRGITKAGCGVCALCSRLFVWYAVFVLCLLVVLLCVLQNITYIALQQLT